MTTAQEELGNLQFQKEVEDAAKEAGLVKQESDVVEEKVYTDVEKEQMEKGWDPTHPNGVSAEEFKRVGEIIEAKRKASKRAKDAESKIDQLQQAVNQLLDHNKKVAQQTREQVYSELESKRVAAMQEGNVPEVYKIEQEQKKLGNSPSDTPKSQQFTEAQYSFADRNKDWFNPDPQNEDLVIAVEHEYNKQMAIVKTKNLSLSEEEVLKKVEDNIKNTYEYKSKYGKTTKEKVDVPLVEPPSSTSTKPTKTTVLSVDDRIQLQQIRLADPKFSEKDFLDMKNQLKK
jgi:hypothetical protein